ncbi:MAG: ribosome maturation factor RimM [Acidobacteriota bacterium]
MEVSSEHSEWIVAGRLGRVRGRIGELAGAIDSNQPGRAERLKDVLLKAGPREIKAEVERLWFHQGRPIFKFVGIDSISDAEPWEHAEILVPPSERVQPEPGEYLDADLIGCVLLDGVSRVGIVQSVDDYGGGPLLTVLRTDGREALVPFAKAICQEIDVAGKIIRVQLPEGLLDL